VRNYKNVTDDSISAMLLFGDNEKGEFTSTWIGNLRAILFIQDAVEQKNVAKIPFLLPQADD
jgi:hypothetical protein